MYTVAFSIIAQTGGHPNVPSPENGSTVVHALDGILHGNKKGINIDIYNHMDESPMQ